MPDESSCEAQRGWVVQVTPQMGLLQHEAKAMRQAYPPSLMFATPARALLTYRQTGKRDLYFVAVCYEDEAALLMLPRCTSPTTDAYNKYNKYTNVAG
jgi:hypothetical protein